MRQLGDASYIRLAALTPEMAEKLVVELLNDEFGYRR